MEKNDRNFYLCNQSIFFDFHFHSLVEHHGPTIPITPQNTIYQFFYLFFVHTFSLILKQPQWLRTRDIKNAFQTSYLQTELSF